MSSKIRIIIVDDLVETRENVRILLKFEQDIEIVGEAGTGQDAIKLAQEKRPDIIIMDINMPGIDGISATREISNFVPSAQTIIMSVQSDSDYLRLAMLAGAKDFLTKPFGGNQLVAAIHGVYDHRPIYRQSHSHHSVLTQLQKNLLQQQLIELSERTQLYKHNPTQANLVDELARLVSGLAHDLRSPLALILATLQPFEEGKDYELNSYLARIERRIKQCLWIANNFLAINFNEKTVVNEIVFSKLFKEILELLSNIRPPSLEIKFDVDDDFLIKTDKKLLRLVLTNIISNSYEAMPNGGRLAVSILEGDDNVKIGIFDNGEEILQNNVNKLFTIGFTTKSNHTGLGLYVSKRIVHQLLGSISFRHNHKEGSLFIIELPQNKRDRLNYRLVKKRIEQLKEDIYEQQQKGLNLEQHQTVSSQFQDISSRFAQQLGNELSIIEITIQEALYHAETKKNSSIVQLLTQISKNSVYARLLVRNIEEMGTGSTPKWHTVSLVKIIQDVLALLERKMPSHLYDVASGAIDIEALEVEADEIQLKQVFMNLFKNALDAMPDGGTLSYQILSESVFSIIDIGDTGRGIPKEIRDQLFHLGFTTKPNGYGIGLYTIKNIISKHGGTITITKSSETGTIFRIQLPKKQNQEH